MTIVYNSKTHFIQNNSRIQSLDGWRGLSVISVLFGHIMVGQGVLFPWLFDETWFKILYRNNFAINGVNCFFVISGFIITHLLILEQKENDKISVRRFYFRRLFRIFPVFYSYLFFLILLNNPLDLGIHFYAFLKGFFYLYNFNFWIGHTLINHSWSLSVEEQYYLLWPLFISLGLRFDKMIGIIAGLCFFSSFSRIFFYLPHGIELDDIFWAGFITQFDNILIGASAAAISFKYDAFILFSKPLRRNLLLVLAIIVYSSFEYCKRFMIFGFITVPFSNTCQSISIALFILYTTTKKSPLSIFLNAKLLRKIGLMSYSIYVWQQFFLIPAAEILGGKISSHWYNYFPQNIAFSLIFGFFSYIFIEKNMLRWRMKIEKRIFPKFEYKTTTIYNV